MRTFYLRFPEGRPKAVTFSYDDGAVQDLRLASLFDRYGLKATFNFNCERAREHFFTKEQFHEHFLLKGHEIAIHGAMHRANGIIRPIEGIREVLECRIELEKKCDAIIRGMAYPDSGVNEILSCTSYNEIKSYLTQLDIAYARVLGPLNNSFKLPADFHKWMPTAHHDDPKLMGAIDEFLSLDLSENVYHAFRTPKLLYIWGHSFEFDRNNNWDRIKEICQRVAHHDDFWYATNIEIYDYVQAYYSLRHSADGKMIYNPTLYTIWFDVDARLYSIKPGETLRIEE